MKGGNGENAAVHVYTNSFCSLVDFLNAYTAYVWLWILWLRHLEVSVHYAHGVEIVDCIQDLPNEPAGIHLCVEALLYNAVKQLTSRHPIGTCGKSGKTGWLCCFSLYSCNVGTSQIGLVIVSFWRHRLELFSNMVALGGHFSGHNWWATLCQCWVELIWFLVMQFNM